MDDFAVRADPEGVLWLAGEFDLAALDVFEAVMSAVQDSQGELVLDLSELTFLDSTGIRAIIVVAGEAAGGVVLRRPTPPVRRILDLVGIDGHRGIKIQD